MSFRTYGGMKYAPRNNYVTNQYANTGYLGITTVLGQSNSVIDVASDLSGNISGGCTDISGSLVVTRDVTIGGELDVCGNVVIGGSLDTLGNVLIEGSLDVSGAATFDSSINLASPPTMTYTELTSTLLPTQLGYIETMNPFDGSTQYSINLFPTLTTLCSFSLLPGVYTITINFVFEMDTYISDTFFALAFGIVNSSTFTGIEPYVSFVQAPVFLTPSGTYFSNTEMTVMYQVETDGVTYGFGLTVVSNTYPLLVTPSSYSYVTYIRNA